MHELGIVFHIIAEYHQLRDINKTAELFVWEALFVHSCTLGQHPTMIIWLLNFNKTKWHTVYKQSDVRSELILTVFAGKFGRKMECVVSDIVKVY